MRYIRYKKNMLIKIKPCLNCAAQQGMLNLFQSAALGFKGAIIKIIQQQIYDCFNTNNKH